IDWQRGDNIVTTNLEFPSVAYAWRNLRKNGVEVRFIPHKDWMVHESDLLDAVDSRTRVLAVSHASFYTGQCLDLIQLGEGARKKGALFAVDATHSSGALQVAAEVTDLTVSSAYKWLLTTHGVAPCYLSERAEAQTVSTSFGWRNLAVWPAQSAERHADADEMPMPEKLEPGNPAMQVVMHLDHALGIILDLGIATIAQSCREGFGRVDPSGIYGYFSSRARRAFRQHVLCVGRRTWAGNRTAKTQRVLLGRIWARSRVNTPL
ncbi:MAG: aminotransferase class V-fold PLP-dependent enzyme, partial [bacterium]|nr:aminotransferase class V-fold PLP-dependent enzyme [bacterium]